MCLYLSKLSQKNTSLPPACFTWQRNYVKIQKVKYFMLMKHSALDEVTKGSDSCAR